MRKKQKAQAEEVVRLLGRVHDGIKRAIETGRQKEAMDLLAQCQESAIELGGMIEETEGKDFVTIPFLEAYCERVYEAYEAVGQGYTVNGTKTAKSLRRALIQAENSIKNDIKARQEAVFLPYKASMWDSLESVWKAADGDPDCDAYVIPIPYYTKKPDGSFREEHYEGDQYPDYVPVTWYEDYDFAGRQPDAIFIHNPYDNNNYLTSVHPFFYSKNLKQFTEKLVYIPYFISPEIEPDDEEGVKRMENFCTTPGVVYADKVFVQSEKMRQIYINVMTKFTEGYGLLRKDWDKKIFGFGSPKIDKVLNTRKDDQNIPEEWLQVMTKTDGSLKKVILYNTGLTAFLQHSRQYLDKMEDVFQIFREASSDVTLLWRPHPLLRNTIQSMREALSEDYEKLLEEYCREGWGIYDESAELNRAIAVCDAYYGDGSSVVQLCEKAGKPVMIQNLDIQYCKRCDFGQNQPEIQRGTT